MKGRIGPSRTDQGNIAAAAGARMIGTIMGKMPTFVMVLQLQLLLLFLTHSLRQVQSEVYMVQMDESPVVHYDGSIAGYQATAVDSNTKLQGGSLAVQKYAEYLRASHDTFLAATFPDGGYTKLYSYSYVLNGFAIDISQKQAGELATHPRVKRIEADSLVRKATTHSPEYLNLPGGAWDEVGGTSTAGEDVVIGLVDTGINPAHPSFANYGSYGPLSSFRGTCDVAPEFPAGSCNNKLIGARYFAAAAIAAGAFNASVDFASPLDGDGHGTHTASTAGGNYGVPVEVDSLYFGQASGIAPRARIAMYKALYRSFGGFFGDVVAAIDQAVADGVDILSLSISPGAPPDIIAVYLSTLDIALLGAVRAGTFVAQAAGNSGPFTESVLSFSPWIVSVAAGSMDRNYSNSITLGNGQTLSGDGLAAGTPGTGLYSIVLATDVNVTSNPVGSLIDECQSSDYYDKTLVEGSLLVCTYDINFLIGNVSFKLASDTAKNLSAAGLIYVVSDDLIGLQGYFTILNSQGVPAIVIDTTTATEEFYSYYNSSTKKVGHNTTFGAKAKLNGGIDAVYTGAPPVVASFSSRGPDFNNISFIPADVLKPNIMAPGVSIWAAWSPIGIDDADFIGQNFAIISGTSMATPHIAGIAALVKEKFPNFSPAAIHSALAGTAFTVTQLGAPLQAQFPDPNNLTVLLGPASPFDLGAGQVDALRALNPGLIFEAGFDDYIKFLCLIPLVNASEVHNTTGSGCPCYLSGYPSDLNTPYISIGVLNGSRTVPRTVTNVYSLYESYSVQIDSPTDILSSVMPTSFSLYPGQSQTVIVTLEVLRSTNTSFGQLHFSGSHDHAISIPITVAQQIP
ncbi:unnamed protein product [Calypogeia fissa]